MYDLAGHPVTLGYMSWADVVSEKDRSSLQHFVMLEQSSMSKPLCLRLEWHSRLGVLSGEEHLTHATANWDLEVLLVVTEP